MSQEILEMIKKEIDSNTIVLFTKGTADMRCAASRRAIAVFKELGRPFKTVDILPDPASDRSYLRQQLADVPQVFVAASSSRQRHHRRDVPEGRLKPLVEQAFNAKQAAPAR